MIKKERVGKKTQVRMEKMEQKKIGSWSIAILIAIGIIILVSLLSSCQKEEISTPVEKVRIFMSAPQTDGLKSATTARTEIANGDTVYVQDITDINIILSSEGELQQPIDGIWSIFNIDNDRDFDQSSFTLYSGSRSEYGSMISTKLKFFGLYKAEFISKSGTELHFFICHTGMPGTIGDYWDFNFSFRLDKNAYQIDNKQGYHGYTLYLRYKRGDLPSSESGYNPSSPENFRALLECGGGNTFIPKNGVAVSAKEFLVKECKYSPGYVCFSFVSEFTPAFNGTYRVFFYSGDFGYNWWSFKSVRESDWSKDGRIVFQTI